MHALSRTVQARDLAARDMLSPNSRDGMLCNGTHASALVHTVQAQELAARDMLSPNSCDGMLCNGTHASALAHTVQAPAPRRTLAAWPTVCVLAALRGRCDAL